jgi:hypothetical protein
VRRFGTASGPGRHREAGRSSQADRGTKASRRGIASGSGSGVTSRRSIAGGRRVPGRLTRGRCLTVGVAGRRRAIGAGRADLGQVEWEQADCLGLAELHA